MVGLYAGTYIDMCVYNYVGMCEENAFCLCEGNVHFRKVC